MSEDKFNEMEKQLLNDKFDSLVSKPKNSHLLKPMLSLE